MELSPAIVTNKKNIGEQTLGIANAKKSLIWGSGGVSSDEFAQKITLPDTGATYHVKRVYVGASRFVADIPMILHIYTIGANDKPGIEVLQDKIVFTKKDFQKRSQRFSIDLRPYNIFLRENAVYVGVEWLPVLKKRQGCTAIILTGDIAEAFTYFRSDSFMPYQWSPTFNEFNNLTQTNPNNTIISIETDILK